jgi:succinyl-diaminopimelate desuccinylase
MRSDSDLLAAAARLVDIPSVSRDERAIADHVESALRGHAHLDVVRIGDNVVATTSLGRPTRAILAGHLDTVPPAGNATAVIEDDRLYGVGSADMKGGLAVMLALAADVVEPSVDCTYVFYTCEEIDRAASGLLELGRARPDLLRGDVAIVLEPTNAIIEAGCQGVVRASVTIRGKRAHSARPWVGSNAIHRAAPLLAWIAAFDERQPTIDGVTYHESMQAVSIEGGVAGNVIPDAVTVVVSHRFAPDREVDEAAERLVAYLSSAIDPSLGDGVELRSTAPAARPNLDHPMLRTLAAASGAAPVAKTAWTDVARFAELGIPAANFGPGDPLLAHSGNEYVEAAECGRVAAAIAALVA